MSGRLSLIVSTSVTRGLAIGLAKAGSWSRRRILSLPNCSCRIAGSSKRYRSQGLAEAHERVLHECQVSALAAAILLSEFLSESIVYASEMDDRVEFSGRTEGTIASPLERDTRFPSDPFNYSEHHSVATVQGRKLHWWKLPRAIRVDTKDARPWREILDSILHDICDSDQVIVKHRKSINGVIGYAFSQCGDKSNVESVTSACVQRLGDRPAYDALVRHDSFSGFIRKRAEDLASGGRR